MALLSFNDAEGDYRLAMAEQGMIPILPPTNEGIFVATCGVFSAGVLLYSGMGPFAIAEFGVTNPRVSARRRHLASQVIAQKLAEYATIRGVIIQMSPTTKGLVRILERAGFKQRNAAFLAGGPRTVDLQIEVRPETDLSSRGAKTRTELRDTVRDEGHSIR